MPDFRNLGTVLRIVLAVNAGAALYAFARAPQLPGLVDEWTLAATVVEPYLFLMLALLYAASPRLAGLTFSTGAAVVALFAVLAGVAWFAAWRTIVASTTGVLLVWLIWALLATGALLLYFELRSRALSPAITEARLQALQARIRPHFLFNSINAVLSLVRQDPARAEEALQDMADLFRVLMRDNRDLAPLADEVELCRQYLELEKLRLGDRLHVDWNVKSMPADALVPPLVLQPLLENAVYHGIEPLSSPGTVSINLFLSRGEVHAILRNPYRADSGNHHAGNKMALGNVRERLALHFDAEASLESRVTKDGYEVHIRLPYRTASVAPTDAEASRARAAVRGTDGKGAAARTSLRPQAAPARPRESEAASDIDGAAHA